MSLIKVTDVQKKKHDDIFKIGIPQSTKKETCYNTYYTFSFFFIGLCDYQHDLGHDAVLAPWLKEYLSILKAYYPKIEPDNIQTTFIPRWKVSLEKCEDKNTTTKDGLTEDIYFAKGIRDSFVDATQFQVVKNYRTTHVTHFQVSIMSLRASI